MLLIACQSNGHLDQQVSQSFDTPQAEAQTEKEFAYIAEERLPRRIAVTKPSVRGDVRLDAEMAQLIRGVLRNYLAGKGYVLVDNASVDQCGQEVGQKQSEQAITAFLNCLRSARHAADGAVLITVHEYDKVNIGFLEHYALDAGVTFYDAAGQPLGSWRDRATRRKVALATDPLSAVLTVAASAVTAKGGVHQRDVTYDWAFNITALMPALSTARTLPQVQRVVTNIGERPFKQGEQIAIGFEGDRGLRATFDIGDFRKDVPMTEKEPGVYIGTYVVTEGDVAKSQPVTLRLTAADGTQRDWPETEKLATIDGKPPGKPESFQAQVIDRGIMLRWQSNDPEVASFIVQRSLEPLAGYEERARVARFEWQDSDVTAGTTYYYRVFAEDHAGNPSALVQSVPVTLPISGERVLTGELQGRLVAGIYRLQGEVRVPATRRLELAAGVSMLAEPQARLLVSGTLIGREVSFRIDRDPAQADALNDGTDSTASAPGRWQGIEIVEGGQIDLEKGFWRECNVCLIINGTAKLRDCQWQDSDTGISINTSGGVYIEGGRLQRLNTALLLEDGRVELRRVTMTEKSNRGTGQWRKPVAVASQSLQ